MSDTYKLELGAPVAPNAVLSALLESAAGAVEEQRGARGFLPSGVGFHVDVAEYDPPDPVEEEFGFAPTVEVYFGLSRSGDFYDQETDVIRSTLDVLARIAGDALLHSQHDEVYLLRRDGRLTVNESLWQPQQLALLTQPYESAHMAFD